MKRRFLIIVLCLACATSFAQTTTKKTPPAKNGTTPKSKTGSATKSNAASTKKQVPKPDTGKVAADNSKITGSAVKQPAPTTTTAAAKTPVTPAKPFERPEDGYYKKTNIMNAKVTPYAHLDESIVPYQRRIWREFDLRETANAFMASPKGRLIDIIMDAVSAGELTAYDPAASTKDDPDGDQFSTPLTPEKAKLKMADSSVVNVIDPKTGDKTGSKMVAGEYNPDSVLRFRIKEDVIFDAQRSVQEIRIIGIAPLVKPKVDGAVNLDYQPAFWIYFPDARKILVTKEVVSSRNDATGLSYDDIFNKRLFTSYIVKQSNDQDLSIKNYAKGIDRLYESERIKKSLIDWELNLWQY